MNTFYTGCKNFYLNFCLTSEKGPSDVKQNVSKFFVIKSDLLGLRIAMFILPTKPRG